MTTEPPAIEWIASQQFPIELNEDGTPKLTVIDCKQASTNFDMTFIVTRN